MNREIKFRGQRKLNGKWVYGSYIAIGEDWCQIVPVGTEYDEINVEKTRVITETVGQYAGFKDKNGVDVYEDDIVEAWSAGSKGIFRIVFRQEGSPCWLLYPNGQNRKFWNIHVTEYSKEKKFISLEGNPYKSEKEGFYDTGLVVIGNYHEHPELLPK